MKHSPSSSGDLALAEETFWTLLIGWLPVAPPTEPPQRTGFVFELISRLVWQQQQLWAGQ